MKRVVAMALFTALWFVAGCGPGGVEVDGKVTKDGKPYSLADGEALNIGLQGEGADAATGVATVQKDGSFTAKKSDGKPLPPGKYKVTVTHYPPTDGAKGPPQSKTVTAGETWEVSASNKSFTVDLAKYK